MERRPKNTARNYGKGTAEYLSWCAAPAGARLNGVLMDETKEPYSPIVTPEKVLMYVTYLVSRPLLVRRGRACGDAQRLKRSTIDVVLASLSDLQKTQRTEAPEDSSNLPSGLWQSIYSLEIGTLLSTHGYEEAKRHDADPTFDHGAK